MELSPPGENLLLLERDLIYKAGLYLLYRKVVHGMLPFWERDKLPGSFFFSTFDFSLFDCVEHLSFLLKSKTQLSGQID